MGEGAPRCRAVPATSTSTASLSAQPAQLAERVGGRAASAFCSRVCCCCSCSAAPAAPAAAAAAAPLASSGRRCAAHGRRAMCACRETTGKAQAGPAEAGACSRGGRPQARATIGAAKTMAVSSGVSVSRWRGHTRHLLKAPPPPPQPSMASQWWLARLVDCPPRALNLIVRTCCWDLGAQGPDPA